MASTDIVKSAPQAVQQAGNSLGTLQGMLEKYKHQIAVALPRHMTPERMIRVGLTAVSSSPGLMECAPLTIAACIVQASILGLEPSSVLGEAYLVPFWNGKTKRKECQLIPGYQGLVKLARNSGEVSMIDAQIVYSADDFDFHKGSEIWWRHKWARTGERGTPEGVWAGYVLKDGSRNFEYWTIEQIERHRDRYSKGAFDRDGQLTGAWKDSPEWMFKKTVLRQVIKLMPKSVELATALSLEERADVGVGQVFDALPAELQPQGEDIAGEQPAALAAPKRKSETATQEVAQ
jgi:recombination protein RecT